MTLEDVKRNHPWASNYSDEVLLITMKKYPHLFNPDEVKFFVWGEDPITGKVIPAIAGWSTPVIGIAVALIALYFVSRMK